MTDQPPEGNVSRWELTLTAEADVVRGLPYRLRELCARTVDGHGVQHAVDLARQVLDELDFEDRRLAAELAERQAAEAARAALFPPLSQGAAVLDRLVYPAVVPPWIGRRAEELLGGGMA